MKWNVLIAVWSSVSLRKLNWPAVSLNTVSTVTSSFSLLSAKSQIEPGLVAKPPPLPTHIWCVYSQSGGHRAIWNLYFGGLRSHIWSPSCHVAINIHFGAWRRAVAYFVPPFFFADVHSITVHFCATKIPLLPSLLLSLTSITVDPLISRLCSHPSLLFLSLLKSSCTLASPSSTFLELIFFQCLLFLIVSQSFSYAGLQTQST